ncbi:MAG: hypothetical protein EWM45_09835 [Rhodopseudomonas palustris]|nr:MAG: hypothetical protein EWM45_09835 [Rhodopseudomonas palustris]
MEGRKFGRCDKRTTAGSLDGDHVTCCCAAERPGLAGKSQPPTLLLFVRQRQGFGARTDETGVLVLIGMVPAKAFPGEALDRQSIEEIVAAVVSPV